MKWEQELEQVIEHAEMAEEAALSELGAFGCVWFEDGLGEADIPDYEEDRSAYEAGWQAFEDFGELVLSELY